MKRSWAWTGVGVALCIAAAAVWVLRPDESHVWVAASQGTDILAPYVFGAMLLVLGGLALLVLGTPPIRWRPRLVLSYGRPPALRSTALVLVAGALGVFAFAEHRAPRVVLRIESAAAGVSEGRRVLYVVARRAWADSLAAVCWSAQRLRESIRDSVAKDVFRDVRGRGVLSGSPFSVPVDDATLRARIVERLSERGFPDWLGHDVLMRPIYDRAAQISQRIARDSAIVSPAGYTSPLAVPGEHLLILVGERVGTYPLVYDIKFNRGLSGEQSIRGDQLDARLCWRIISP